MKGLSVFQITLFVVFGLVGVAGLIAFATMSASDSKKNQPVAITVWGIIPDNQFKGFLDKEKALTKSFVVTYVYKPVDVFESSLVEALADGNGPDAVIISDLLIAPLSRKLYVLNAEMYPERTFRDTFTEAASVYITPKGILGLPLLIDPLVMYWNRDHLSSAGIVAPPTEWSAFLGLSEQLTKRDKVLNIQRSTVSFGEYANVRNAKDILATFFLQTGSPIVARDAQGRLKVSLNNTEASKNQISSALDFYAQFSNPTLPVYTWNRARPDSQEAFVGDTLTFYFGFSSELSSIRERNPNLNFDIAQIPQRRIGDVVTTASRVYAVSALKNSPRLADAARFMYAISGKETVKALSDNFSLPPSRRDILSVLPADAYRVSNYRAAIFGRSWFDPDFKATGEVFRRAIESITVGSVTSAVAVEKITSQIDQLLSSTDL